MPYCSACGEEVGNPNEQLHDPDNLLQIVEGGASNPDSAHIEAKDGPKGPRMFCTNTGQTTKIQQEPPGDGSGTDPSQGPNPEPKREPSSGEVYDLPEETDAMDILESVIATPVFGLDDEQIGEVLSWGDIYDGQVPPDVVQNLLENLKGVSKQKSSLMRQKYEAKLNKWIQERSREQGGPSIGVQTSPPMPQQGGPSGGRIPPQPPSNENPEGGQGGGPSESGRPTPPPGPEPNSTDPREERRKRRIERRNDAMDVAAQRFAEQATQQMAQDIGGIFGDMREVAYTAFKKKAEKDPDWFFEKMEQWDVDILDAVLEPSEARKEEMGGSSGGGGGGFGADMDVDNALEEMGGLDDSPEPQQTPENTNKGEPQQGSGDPMSASPEDAFDEPEEDLEDEDSAFEEIMGEAKE